MSDTLSNKAFAALVMFTLIFIVGLSLIGSAFEIVDSGYRGVVISKIHGTNLDRVMGEGFNWKVPFVDTIEEWSIQKQKYTATAAASSKDLQEVSMSLTLNYSLVAAELPNLRQEIGANYEDIILTPLTQQIVKSIVAQYPAEDLIIHRAEVKDKVAEYFMRELPKSHIAFVAVALTDFDFSKKFNLAIEQKVEAAQHALKAEQLKKQRTTDAEADRIERELRSDADLYEQTKQAEAALIIAQKKAEGVLVMGSAEAEANTKIAKSLTPSLLRLKWFESWDGTLPKFLTGGGSSGVLPIYNVTDETSDEEK